MLFSEQIAKIGEMDLSVHWLETLVKAGSEEDRKAVAAWMTLGKAKVEKALVDMRKDLYVFSTMPEDEQNSMDPALMTLAMKADKSIMVAQAVLKNLLEQTKWPAGSRVRAKVQQQADTLAKHMVVFRQTTKEGKVLHTDGAPKPFKGPQTPADAHGPEFVLAQRALAAFHQARETAIKHKAAYADAKLKAKALFVEYQNVLKKVSPAYAMKTFDWEDADVLEKIKNDPMLKAALERAGLQ